MGKTGSLIIFVNQVTYPNGNWFGQIRSWEPALKYRWTSRWNLFQRSSSFEWKVLLRDGLAYLSKIIETKSAAAGLSH